MAFHVRLVKHNLLQLSRIRAVPYATQTSDRYLDRQLVDQHATTIGVSNNLKYGETHMYMSGVRSQPSSTDERSGLSQSEKITNLFSTIFPSGSLTEASKLCLNQKDCLPKSKTRKPLLPMTVHDLELILLDAKKEDISLTDDLKKIVKEVYYTDDDILVKEVASRKSVSTSVISHENRKVSILDGAFGTCATPRNICRMSEHSSNIVFCQGADVAKTPEGDHPHLPSKEQLVVVERYFTASLPTFLKERHDYRIYNKDIIFENNFWEKSVTTRGINAYAVQLMKFRWLVHLKYANAHFHILKITHHPEDGTVRIRWRVSGLPQMVVFQFWKLLPWNFRKSRERETEWYDGFSILTVGKDGFVHKHKLDRVIPDEQVEVAKTATLPLAGI